MRGAIMGWHVAILGLDQHLAILVDENGAERMIAVGQSAAGDVERTAQKMLVEFGWAHIRHAVHGRASPVRSCRRQMRQASIRIRARSRKACPRAPTRRVETV